MFRGQMTDSTNEFVVCQSDLSSKLGLKPNYTLTQNIILESFELSISQLSARVGQLLPPIVPLPKRKQPALQSESHTSETSSFHDL